VQTSVRDIRILVVDDQPHIVELARRILENEGYSTLSAGDGAEALRVVDAQLPDAVLMDINMPGMDGISALRELTRKHPTVPVIMMSGYSDVSTAVTAMKLGARNYLCVPLDPDELVLQVTRCLEETRVRREMTRLQTILGDSAHLCELMGYSPHIIRLTEQISTVAPTDFTVVVYGESGSGKELVARAIHRMSKRSAGPFVPVDCGSIPETLIESELFGHERGAFTGAYRQQEGSFERASGGTLLLDEIGNLPKSMQAKLLRALQERKVAHVGGTQLIDIDIRVIAAGNTRLEDLIRQGVFREDLYHRLNEFFIEIPPLRERKEDLVYLAKRFMDLTAEKLRKEVRGISDAALQIMLDYDWPGNVRELRNSIQRAVLLCDGTIRPADLTGLLPAAPRHASAALSSLALSEGLSLKQIGDTAKKEAEAEAIRQVLEKTEGNKSQAARILQVDYKTILTKIRDYGLDAPRP